MTNIGGHGISTVPPHRCEISPPERNEYLHYCKSHSLPFAEFLYWFREMVFLDLVGEQWGHRDYLHHLHVLNHKPIPLPSPPPPTTPLTKFPFPSILFLPPRSSKTPKPKNTLLHHMISSPNWCTPWSRWEPSPPCSCSASWLCLRRRKSGICTCFGYIFSGRGEHHPAHLLTHHIPPLAHERRTMAVSNCTKIINSYVISILANLNAHMMKSLGEPIVLW